MSDAGPQGTAPIEEGETHEVEIVDTGDEGDGIARIEGFIVFVEEADMGERVEVEITNVQDNFGFAEVVE